MEENIIFESSDAIFHEDKSSFKSKNSGRQIISENILSSLGYSTSFAFQK